MLVRSTEASGSRVGEPSSSHGEDAYAEIDRLAAEHQPALVAMRRDIHSHPELSKARVVGKTSPP
jgi:hypothetical protein